MNFNTLADFFAGQPEDLMSPAIRGMAESDSEDGEVDIYVGEMEQVYETESQPVYETDDEGNLVYDDNDQLIPLEDDEGNVIYEEQTVYDENGNPVPVLDEDGNPVFEKVQLVDCDGEPIVEYDADGNPIAQTDEHGDPIYIEDDQGNPLPVLDENDEPVYTYDENGDEVPLYQVLPVEESQVVTIGTVGAVKAGETPVVTMGFGGAAAIASDGWGDRVEVAIDNAATIAEEAAEVAEATNQHFFSDTQGVHVTETENDATTGHNILINSIGILLRSAVSNLVSITRSAIAFFDSNGDMTASFGTNGAQVGRSGEPNVWIDSTGAYITGDSDGYVRTVVDSSGMYLYDDNSGAYPYPVARLMAHVASVAEDADSATPGMFSMFGNTFQMAGGSLDGSGIAWWNQISSSHGPIYLFPQDNTHVIIGTDDPAMGRHLTRDGAISGATSVGHGSGLDVHGSVNVDGGVYIGSGNNNYAVTKAAMDTALADKSDKFVILSYGNSTWADFLAAYNSNTVVYCRASSNSNPATGAQTRLAFMAYVNADPPTNVEFQYYRSVSSHTASQQGDQVYVYKLTSSGAWSVTVREASVKVAAGSGLDMSYASGTATLSLGSEVGSRVTNDQSTAVSLTSGTWGEICNVSLDAGTWIVHGNVQHASNATGRRGACLSTSTSAPGTGDMRQRGMQVPAVNGAATMLNTCITMKLAEASTVRLYGLQTSGAANNATGCITAVRIV